MNHQITKESDERAVSYGWRFRGEDCKLSVRVRGEPQDAKPGSVEEFISEHYWGYTRTRSGRTGEYRVEHPRWRVWDAESHELTGNLAALYGREFADVLRTPSSVFLAEGSDVRVYNRAMLDR